MKVFIPIYVILLVLLSSCQQQEAHTRMAKDNNLSKQPDGTLISSNDSIQPQPQLAKPIPADQLIVPGKSIGLTHVGEDMNTVLKRLGKPDAGDNAMGKSMSFWYAGHQPAGYKTAIYASRQMGTVNEQPSRVKQLLITSPYFKTDEGVHTGLTYQQVAAHYELRKVSVLGKGPRQLRVYECNKGIAFEFDTHQICKGIIVHAPEEQGGVTYLAFHPELERP